MVVCWDGSMGGWADGEVRYMLLSLHGWQAFDGMMALCRRW